MHSPHIPRHYRTILLITFLTSCALLLVVRTHANALDNGWIAFEKCPVMVEHKLDIPAQERGFLRLLQVELNQAVTAGQVLAELDTELAELELRMAKLEQAQSNERALDDSDVKFQEVVLQKSMQDLDSHRAISTSVSESEIRSRTLGVAQAELGLKRAERAQRLAVGEAKLRAAAVEVAELRLAQRRIVAPRNGVVTAVKLHPGQSVEAGQTIMEIQDLEHLLIDRLIPIAQFNVAELVGSDVRVDVEQSGGAHVRLSGQIISYDPHVSSGGLVRVHAKVKNVLHGNDWVLLPGSEVTMYVAHANAPAGDQAKASTDAQRIR